MKRDEREAALRVRWNDNLITLKFPSSVHAEATAGETKGRIDRKRAIDALGGELQVEYAGCCDLIHIFSGAWDLKKALVTLPRPNESAGNTSTSACSNYQYGVKCLTQVVQVLCTVNSNSPATLRELLPGPRNLWITRYIFSVRLRQTSYQVNC